MQSCRPKASGVKSSFCDWSDNQRLLKETRDPDQSKSCCCRWLCWRQSQETRKQRCQKHPQARVLEVARGGRKKACNGIFQIPLGRQLQHPIRPSVGASDIFDPRRCPEDCESSRHSSARCRARCCVPKTQAQTRCVQKTHALARATLGDRFLFWPKIHYSVWY